jgi:hypothetical protein
MWTGSVVWLCDNSELFLSPQRGSMLPADPPSLASVGSTERQVVSKPFRFGCGK